MKEDRARHLIGDESRDFQPSTEIFQALRITTALWGPNKEICESFLDEIAKRMDVYRSRWTTLDEEGNTYRYQDPDPKEETSTIRFIRRINYLGVTLSLHKIDKKTETTYKKGLQIYVEDNKPKLTLERSIVCVALHPPRFPSDSCVKITVTDSNNAKVEEKGAITVFDLVRSKPKREYFVPVSEAVKKVVLF